MSGYDRLPKLPRRPDEAARDVDRELDFHLEMRVRELEGQGLTPEAARREAERRFGDVEGARRRLREEAARSSRRAGLWQQVEETWRDVRYAARGLRASPGWAAVAVLTLALGIGATTAIFSALNAVLLRPLPYAEPDRLVRVWEVTPEGDDHNIVSPGNFFDWRGGSGSFESLEAHGFAFSAGLTGGERPIQVRIAQATAGMFDMLGVAAAVGRTFVAEEGVPGTEAVALLTHGFWQRRFGGDRGVIGSTLTISEQPVRVVGVMPAEFAFPQPGLDLVMPLRLDAEDREERRSHRLVVIGRLAGGATIERTQAELSGMAVRIAERHPEHMRGWGVNVVAYRDDLVRAVRPSLVILMAAVALVLLVACVNVANLLLARSLSRRRETAVRVALGAGRARLVRLALAESVLLAVLGGALGLGIVAVTLRLLVGFGPADVPLLQDTRIDAGTLVFAAAAALLSALLFGALPALRAASTDPQRALREAHGAGGGRTLRTSGALLVAEVALGVMLMVGSGLLIRSLMRVQDESLGFDADRLASVSLDLPYSRYDGRAAQTTFYRTLIDRIEGLPGVRAVVGTTEPPVVGFDNTFSFEIEGRPRPGPNPRQEPASLRPVTGGYFEAMRIPLVAGRTFTERDRSDAPPVAIINETMARTLWPSGDAVGARIRRGEDQPWIEVVGIVGDTRHFGLEEPLRPAWYIPYEQAPWGWMSWMTLLVRSERPDAPALSDALEQAVWSLDRDLPIHRIGLVEDFYAEGLARRRFVTFLLGTFAALALVLGAIGLYGVLSYSVAGRTREFGVRLALGASPRDVAGRILRDGLALTLLGLAIGTAAALALSGFMRSLLWGVEPADPLTLAAVAVVLLATAAVACWLPARRATRADPLAALRSS